MTELLQRYEAYVAHWKAKGKPVAQCDPPCGCRPFEVTTPSRENEAWNCLLECPHCSRLFGATRIASACCVGDLLP